MSAPTQRRWKAEGQLSQQSRSPAPPQALHSSTWPSDALPPSLSSLLPLPPSELLSSAGVQTNGFRTCVGCGYGPAINMKLNWISNAHGFVYPSWMYMKECISIKIARESIPSTFPALAFHNLAVNLYAASMQGTVQSDNSLYPIPYSLRTRPCIPSSRRISQGAERCAFTSHHDAAHLLV